MKKAANKKRPTVLEVRLNQVRVGTITNLPNDRNLFVFDEEYAQMADRPVLSMSFYDDERNLITDPEQVQTKVPPFFSNLLPEGRLREYVAELGGIKQAREFFLLWLLGADLPGAVIVQDAEGRPLPPPEERKTETRNETSHRILRFSLAGVQLKFSAVGNPDRNLTIPVEGRGGHWIVKLPSPTFQHVPENEFSMMRLAAAVGIETAEVGLIRTNEVEGLPPELSGETANSLYVRRFDRTEDGRRVHIEDFNQIYHQFPNSKYKNYSYTNMARDIWGLIGEEAGIEFIRRLVFSAAIGNADMHLKNWSVTYSDGRTPRLAPAYDFVATTAYIDDRALALSISRQKDTGQLNENLLERFADRAGIPKRVVLDTARETAESTVRLWGQIQQDMPLDSRVREAVEAQLKYVPLTRQFLKAA
jgi:serine/threonine-protein kinase HipA